MLLEFWVTTSYLILAPVESLWSLPEYILFIYYYLLEFWVTTAPSIIAPVGGLVQMD